MITETESEEHVILPTIPHVYVIYSIFNVNVLYCYEIEIYCGFYECVIDLMFTGYKLAAVHDKSDWKLLY